VELPLFLVVIGSLAAGVLLGGLGAVLEQVRLRTGLRRARKDRDRALSEQGKADALLEGARAEITGLQAEIDEMRHDRVNTTDADAEMSAFVEPVSSSVNAPLRDGDEATDPFDDDATTLDPDPLPTTKPTG
jgi:hypothetical protein